MPIFTARSNFKTEFIKGCRQCQNCHGFVEGKEALVVRWKGKGGKDASFILCNDECWEVFDHNFWLERAWKRTDDESYLDDRLPIKETRSWVQF